jgi:hypothetical protein
LPNDLRRRASTLDLSAASTITAGSIAGQRKKPIARRTFSVGKQQPSTGVTKASCNALDRRVRNQWTAM